MKMKGIWLIPGFCLAALMLPALACPADLQWDDPGAEWGIITGYTVYFTDGTEQYHKAVAKEELARADGVVTYGDIDGTLGLMPGVEYTFIVTAWNESGESDPSNSAAYTREPYSPPADRLPAGAFSPPSPSGLRF